jgi:hypothetical protein
LEDNLVKITSLAHKWEALVLVDEADVYLAERSPRDIYRNSLVSVFLRHLEYFRRILFLTTDRIQTFDPAIQSRIHFAMKFSDLGRDAKKGIWKTFLNRVTKDVEISEKEIETLSDKRANGREVRLIDSSKALWQNSYLIDLGR